MENTYAHIPADLEAKIIADAQNRAIYLMEHYEQQCKLLSDLHIQLSDKEIAFCESEINRLAVALGHPELQI